MSDTEVENAREGSGGQIRVKNKTLLNLLDDQETDNISEAPVTTVYAESPVFSKDDEKKYKFVSEDVDEFDEEQDEALRQSKEREEEAFQQKLENIQINATQENRQSDNPDSEEGNLIGAERDSRVQSGKSTGSTQFAVKRRKGSGAGRKNSANSTTSERESITTVERTKSREASAPKNSTEKHKGKKLGGMKPLTRAEQQDMDELQREEEYQRAEQKKIQPPYSIIALAAKKEMGGIVTELQNKAQGINIPRLDLVDSDDDHKGDSSDLALHEGTPRQEKNQEPSETTDSLEVTNQDRKAVQWSDPPENPFPQQAQRELGSQREPTPSPHSQQHSAQSTAESHRQYQHPAHLQHQGFQLNQGEDPRLQQMFAQQRNHQADDYPSDRSQGQYGSHSGYSDREYDSGRNEMPNDQYQVEPQSYGQYNRQESYDGHYYVEANIAPIQGQMQPSPGRGYQQVPQGSFNTNNGYFHNEAFAPQQAESYQVQNDMYQNQQSYYDPRYNGDERGYNEQYAYDNEPDTVSYQPSHSYSASTYQSTLLPQPEGPDYIAMNKKNLKQAPKKSYRTMYSKKKEAENDPPFVPQGKRSTQLNSPKKANSPLKALPNQRPVNQVNQNQEPMTAEEFWRQRAANLEQRKADKMSGRNKNSSTNLKKYPSESRVDDIRPHRVAPIQQPPHAIAEPIKSEISRSPRGQPITQTVYTEDGQRVSVDINLKLISPPPIGGPTRTFNSYNNHQASYQQQQGYSGHQLAHQSGNHPGHGYSYRQPTPPQNTYGYGGGNTNQFTYRAPGPPQHNPIVHSGRPAWNEPAQGYPSPHYDPDAPYSQSPIQSPYRVLPPIGSAEARERRMEEMYYHELMAKDRPAGGGGGQRDPSPRKQPGEPGGGSSPRRDRSPRRGEDDSGSYMDQFKKNKNKKVEYKEYTLKDFRKMKKEVRLGGLGPDMDSEDVKEKKEKINRQQEYARQIKEKNRLALENSKRKAPPPRSKEDPEKESLLERRKMVLEYARSVPRPKVAPSNPGSKPGGGGSAQSAPGSASTGLNDEEMMELERLAERHAREREQTEVIRQNIESAVSAR